MKYPILEKKDTTNDEEYEENFEPEVDNDNNIEDAKERKLWFFGHMASESNDLEPSDPQISISKEDKELIRKQELIQDSMNTLENEGTFEINNPIPPVRLKSESIDFGEQNDKNSASQANIVIDIKEKEIKVEVSENIDDKRQNSLQPEQADSDKGADYEDDDFEDDYENSFEEPELPDKPISSIDSPQKLDSNFDKVESMDQKRIESLNSKIPSVENSNLQLNNESQVLGSPQIKTASINSSTENLILKSSQEEFDSPKETSVPIILNENQQNKSSVNELSSYEFDFSKLDQINNLKNSLNEDNHSNTKIDYDLGQKEPIFTENPEPQKVEPIEDEYSNDDDFDFDAIEKEINLDNKSQSYNNADKPKDSTPKSVINLTETYDNEPLKLPIEPEKSLNKAIDDDYGDDFDDYADEDFES